MKKFFLFIVCLTSIMLFSACNTTKSAMAEIATAIDNKQWDNAIVQCHALLEKATSEDEIIYVEDALSQCYYYLALEAYEKKEWSSVVNYSNTFFTYANNSDQIASVNDTLSQCYYHLALEAYEKEEWSSVVNYGKTFFTYANDSDQIASVKDMILHCNLQTLKKQIESVGPIPGDRYEMIVNVTDDTINFSVYFSTISLIIDSRMDLTATYDLSSDKIVFEFKRSEALGATTPYAVDSLQGSFTVSSYQYNTFLLDVISFMPSEKNFIVFKSGSGQNACINDAKTLFSDTIKKLHDYYLDPVGLTLADIGFTAIK